MPTVRDLLTALQQIAPESLAEDWDNVGLLVGDPNQQVTSILLALDPTCSLIEQAVSDSYDLVITHHPLIFRPLRAIRTDTPPGRFIATATSHRIGVIACHTNLDSIQGGVSDYLAQSLGLRETRPLTITEKNCGPDCGIGRIGRYASPVSAAAFLDQIKTVCNPPWILEAGPRPDSVTIVALCGGSCSDLADTALNAGAHVFVTAEVKHSVACWAADAGLWLLDAGHFATENPAMLFFRDTLRKEAENRGWNLQVDVACQQPPLRLV
ncbi:MAG: Nif3-like dinuclear metal center hexameric protein [Desulfobulbus oligotrophicus]|nr:Nif3-like dinuclear metal center hexameric protein [Desulfobulbus oligotrophicus]